MRDHSKHVVFSREQATDCIVKESGFASPNRELPIEYVALDEAFGRVLAEDVVSRALRPSARNCNMDSIAVRWSDFEGLAEGEVPDTSTWTRGVEWQFANTGVALPEGFDTAIVIEHVEVSADEKHVTIAAAPSAQFAGTTPPGAQLKPGDVLARAGEVITPDVAARIAGGNHTSVPCVRKPRVAFIPTGNELVPAGVPALEPERGTYAAYAKNFETNSLLVRGKVENWGGVFVPFDIVADEREVIADAIKRACATADVVVLNAGSSKGSDDWSCEVMEEMGEVFYHETTHGPGHHSSFAVVDGVPIVGISGPSGGASFTLNFYLLPAMKAYLGIDPQPVKLPARLTADMPMKMHPGAAAAKKGEQRPSVASADGPAFYGVKPMFAHVGDDGSYLVDPLPGRPGSMSAAHANALFMQSGGQRKGDIVLIELLS